MKLTVIGIDIGGQSLKWGLYSAGSDGLCADVGARRRATSVVETGPQSTPNVTFARLYEQIISRTGRLDTSTLLVGVSTPGLIQSGTILASANLPDWHGTHLPSLISQIFGVSADRVAVANDAVCHTTNIACRNPHDRVFCLTIGTGVVGGFAAGSRVLTDAVGCGEIGHLPSDSRGYSGVLDTVSTGFAAWTCPCGSLGCVELVVSGPGLLRLGRYAAVRLNDPAFTAALGMQNSPQQNLSALVERARYGDPIACDVFALAGVVLANAAAPIRSFFNPSLIAVTGGVARSFDLLRPAFERRLGELCFPNNSLCSSAYSHRIAVDPSGLTGVAGAAELAVRQFQAY